MRAEVTNKYGAHADVVGLFLEEVTGGDVDWADIATGARRAQRRPALSALAEVPYPVALLSAVDKAARQAYASLGLSRADFSHPLDLGTVKTAIIACAQAMAVYEKMAPEHVETLLRPFADAGFESAAAVLGSLEPGTPGPVGSEGER